MSKGGIGSACVLCAREGLPAKLVAPLPKLPPHGRIVNDLAVQAVTSRLDHGNNVSKRPSHGHWAAVRAIPARTATFIPATRATPPRQPPPVVSITLSRLISHVSFP